MPTNLQQPISKYDQVSISVLLRFVQGEAEKIRAGEYKNKKQTKAFKKKLQDLREVQWNLTERIKNLDRRDARFFPLGARVEVKGQPATVKAYFEEEVIIALDSEPETEVKVAPHILKLMYLREKFL